MTNPLPLSSRIYGRLLVLYPGDLRREYGADMALVFAEDLGAARRDAGMRGVVRVWRCALVEFVRFALPARTSSPAERVPAISLALFIAMMSGVVAMALHHAPNTPRPFHVLSSALLLPLFSTPIVSLLSVWACRGTPVISLDLSNNPGKEC